MKFKSVVPSYAVHGGPGLRVCAGEAVTSQLKAATFLASYRTGILDF